MCVCAVTFVEGLFNNPATFGNPEYEWTTTELHNSLKSIEWDLEDLGMPFLPFLSLPLSSLLCLGVYGVYVCMCLNVRGRTSSTIPPHSGTRSTSGPPQSCRNSLNSIDWDLEDLDMSIYLFVFLRMLRPLPLTYTKPTNHRASCAETRN